ncbi:hypothetical protein J1605_007161 [Eschrichtius robustus]|uniref:Uncharacterized protein n=1 Tax=Eschrichtius robustus TaxID=9764 RepID=A0AB34H1P7_ESCRO|nr:hypothetical protein J1605_007161 [Eschrichtius robustus]
MSPASSPPCHGPRSKDSLPTWPGPPHPPLLPRLTTVPLNVPGPIAATRVPASSWATISAFLDQLHAVAAEPVGENLSWGLRAPRATLKPQISSPALPGYMHQNPGQPGAASGAQGPKMTEDTPPPRIKGPRSKPGANSLLLGLSLGGGVGV